VASPCHGFSSCFLLARQQGHSQPADWAHFVWGILAAQGQRLVKDGLTLETEADNLPEITAQATEFANKQLPILRALRVG
jgi:hypothetical protein